MTARMTDTQVALARYRTVDEALHTATLYQLRVASLVDGYPSGGSGRSSDPTSTVERAALQRLEDKEGVHEANRALQGLAEMQEWRDGWATYIADGARLVALHDPSHPAPPDGALVELEVVGPTLEAVANRAYASQTSEGRMIVEDLRDWWTGIRGLLDAGSRLAKRHRPPLEKHAVELCDGRQFEGSELAWVPHSRAHDNGWHDPLCVEVADGSGLCLTCKPRERRWRERHGKKPRNRNRIEDAA